MNDADSRHTRHSESIPSGLLPAPPEIPRRITFTRKQWIGLPLIMLVPILTVLGVFGEHRAEVRASGASLSLVVRYPDRFRYRQVQQLDISVRNASPRRIDTLRVSLDTGYISRFSSVRIVPAPHSAFVVDLTSVAAGETRLVTAELWGEQYGRHRGRVIASAGSDSEIVDLNTFVFP